MNFQIPEFVWWRTHYFPYKNVDLYELIIKNEQKISKDHPFYNILFIFYTLRDELNVKSLDFDKFFSVVNNKNYSFDTNECLKINNFKNALSYIQSHPLLDFDCSCENMLVDQIINIIVTVNKMIGDGFWISNNFRVNEAKPSKECLFYSSPTCIREELILLVRNTVSLIKFNSDCMENVVKTYSYFFTNFLKIHPFTNGNGRTIRLLSYFLFKKYISIPIIFSSNRQVYLKCLSESHVNNNKEAFTALLLESLHHSYELFDYYC